MGGALSRALLRAAIIVLAGALGLGAVWTLPADLFRTAISTLPADAGAAEDAASSRARAFAAARFARVRGDLWAECAFTLSDLFWNAAPSADANALNRARRCATEAVAYAPYQSGVWLLLAGFASRYHWTDISPAEALKMSYYTGPNEPRLTPMRLSIAVRSGALADRELGILVRVDVETILSRNSHLKAAIIGAYRQATPEAKAFLVEAAASIDPVFATSLRSAAPQD